MISDAVRQESAAVARERAAWRRALAEAFPYTLPILAGFWFVGASYGLYMHASGFSAWYPLFMAMIIFGGSLEFIAVAMLMAPFAPVQTAVVALMVQARHLFYGLSMMEKYEGMGWKKPFLIYWMCDETFALNYTATVPKDVDRGWFYFWVSLLDYAYWVTGAVMGGLAGSLLSMFDLRGLDFVMTTMFIVIFLEQLLKEKKHYTAAVGLAAAFGCRVLFGADSFMVPAMAVILLVLTVFRKPLEKAGGFL